MMSVGSVGSVDVSWHLNFQSEPFPFQAKARDHFRLFYCTAAA